MNRIGRFLVVLIFVGIGSSASAAQRTMPDRDLAAIHGVIAGQILAFEKNDGATALRYSTPQLRARFSDGGNFLRMVRENYGAVYRPTQVSFGALDDVDHGTKVQHVLVVDTDGNTHVALYVMEHQKDGTWLIAGVFLMDSDLVAT